MVPATQGTSSQSADLANPDPSSDSDIADLPGLDERGKALIRAYKERKRQKEEARQKQLKQEDVEAWRAFQKRFKEEQTKVEGNIKDRVDKAVKESIEAKSSAGTTLSDLEQAELRKDIEKTDAESHPAWTMNGALSETLGDTTIQSLVEGLVPSCPKNMHIAFFGALASASREHIEKLLQSQSCVKSLAKTIHEEAQKISKAKAATGAELNDQFKEKFMVSGSGLGLRKMTFGTMADFAKGLERRIGSPNPNLLSSMIREHCASCDSEREYEVDRVKTTSLKEFLLIIKEVIKQGTDETRDAFKLFPQEWKDPLLPKRGWPASVPNVIIPGKGPQIFLEELLELNQKLEKAGELQLSLEEGIMIRLYTGPLYHKYNTVLRGGALDGCDCPDMESLFQGLCCGTQDGEWRENRYATSIHVLVSGVVKLTKLSLTVKVYRGLKDLLPDEFWKPDKFGCKGGVEFAFMSTTTDRNVALNFAGKDIPMLQEFETGIVNRGADVRTLSQFPMESELLFPPLTSIEVLDTKADDSGRLILKTRATVNLRSPTINEVISKRQQILTTMVEANAIEADQLFRSPQWRNILAGVPENPGDGAWVNDELIRVFRKVMDKKAKETVSREAVAYNEDSVFLAAVRDLVQLQADCKLQRSNLLLEVGNEAQHERLHQLAETREALEVRKKIVKLSFQAGIQPRYNGLWLFDVLGFEQAADGLFYPSKNLRNRDDSDGVLDVVTKDVKLPGDDWALLAINGCKNLQLQAQALQRTWSWSRMMEMELELFRPISPKDFDKALKKALSNRVGVGQLTELLLSYHRCEDLDLSDVGLDDEQGARIVQALLLVGVHLGNLEQLSFGDNRDFGAETRSGLAKLLAADALPKLRALRLGGCSGLFARADREAMRVFCQSLAHCSALEELDLGRTGLASGAGAGEALAEALPKCTKLRKLRFKNMALFEADHIGSAAFCRALGTLANLEELDLGDTGLVSGPLPRHFLAQALATCKRLRTLEFREDERLFSKEDPVGTAALCHAIGSLGDLEVLDLDSTGLASNAGGDALVEELPRCQKLRQVILSWNPNLFGGSRANSPALFAALCKLHDLEVLKVKRTGLASTDGIEDLLRECKELRILWLHSEHWDDDHEHFVRKCVTKIRGKPLDELYF